MYKITVSAIGVVNLTPDQATALHRIDTSVVSCIEVRIVGIAGATSVTPQIVQEMDGEGSAAPFAENALYRKIGTGVESAAGTAITADGAYIWDTPGQVALLNVTALDSPITLYVKPLQGPASVGGGSSGGGGLTDTQLRATPVPISGTVTATGPLTDTQLRATPVPVSGTVEVTNDVGNPLPVSGTVEVVNDVGNPLPVSGTVEIVNDVGNAIPVSLATAPVLVAGEAHIGSVGGATSNIKPTIAVTASAYATGNCWGGKQTLTNALRSGGPLTGAWAKLTCTWKGTAASAPLLDAVLLTDNPAGTFTDKSAFPTLSTADIALISSRVSITASDWVALGGVAVATKIVGPLPVTGIAATLYAAFNVTSGTPTPAATTDFGAVFGFFND